MKFNVLEPATINLEGRHLIEASAGTGKTFNITRLYLRLLLEKKLPVEQILVMTFTKDATEELRGRIDKVIRESLTNWQLLKTTDPFYQALATQVDDETATQLLQKALLFLDEAAIFTIHSFCQRILTQFSLETGVSVNAQLNDCCQEIIDECVQDWYRQLTLNENADQFELIDQYWPTPNKFLQKFGNLLQNNSAIQTIKSDDIINEFQQKVQLVIQILTDNQQQIFEWLVNNHSKKNERIQEYEQLLAWLNNVITDHNNVIEPLPSAFFDGRRFTKGFRSEITVMIEPFVWVKKHADKLLGKITQAKASAIIADIIPLLRQKIAEKKQQLQLLSFDDLISILSEQLSISSSNHRLLADKLFQQYPAALVDEFQDTDPKQFSIIEAIYGAQTSASLFLIGDPKQAIYGFRGGDIFAYLQARHFCQYHWLMTTNWRSTTSMINGYNRLFIGNNENRANADVFQYDIQYFPVQSSGNVIPHQTLAQDGKQALQFVHFPIDTAETSEKPQKKTNKKKSTEQAFRPYMAMWCANEIVRLLSTKDDQEHAENSAPLLPKDIAILVRSGDEALQIKEALNQANLPSVFLSDRANLFTSQECHQLLLVLNGVFYVEDERQFIAALASDLINFDAEKLFNIQQDEVAFQQLRYQFFELREQWLHRGFMSMALTLLHDHFTVKSDNKDRILTNVIHLFEILQSASQQHKQPQALLYWFSQQCQSDNPEQEAELRLESDNDLIKIVTQHGSKGLQYPIVFIPFSCRYKDPLRRGNQQISVISYHDEQKKLCHCIQGNAEQKLAMTHEQHAESIRLLYVAITRAEQRCYVLTTPFDKVMYSPLGLTLGLNSDEQLLQQITCLTNQLPDSIGLEVINNGAEQAINHYHAIVQNSHYSAAQFKGWIERDWWLSSFTALAKQNRTSIVSLPDRDNIEQTQQSTSSYLARFVLKGGVQTGNFLHDVFEHTDFSHPDWQSSLAQPLQRFGQLNDGLSTDDLIHWFNDVIQAPLAYTIKLSANHCSKAAFCLADLELNQTLREIEFYFPMTVTKMSHLSALLSAHRQQCLTYLKTVAQNEKTAAQAIDELTLQTIEFPSYRGLKGMMHGFIDLIFEHQGKYYVCDYKSNHLGDDFSCYSAENIYVDMVKHQYDLQYLIYSLALHRYLSNRLENYDPQQHFGGVYYCYLRGMSANVLNSGVFGCDISPSQLQQLDDLFAGEV